MTFQIKITTLQASKRKSQGNFIMYIEEQRAKNNQDILEKVEQGEKI